MYNKFITQPSTSFIKAYIEAYNNGKPITKVMVEYDVNDISTLTSDIRTYPNLEIVTLKVDKDNCITIKPIKDSYNLIQLRQLCYQAYIEHLTKDGTISMDYVNASLEPFEKWFNHALDNLSV